MGAKFARNYFQNHQASENMKEFIQFVYKLIVKSFIYFAGNLASNQKMHVELVHLGLKKYKSEICHKTFGQAGAVKTHVFTLKIVKNLIANFVQILTLQNGA